uniref:Uncharacterized protein n=1 Tax=Manihot esculenta TaxID=3983 RepID=A0A2C9VR58_MANES
MKSCVRGSIFSIRMSPILWIACQPVFGHRFFGIDLLGRYLVVRALVC